MQMAENHLSPLHKALFVSPEPRFHLCPVKGWSGPQRPGRVRQIPLTLGRLQYPDQEPRSHHRPVGRQGGPKGANCGQQNSFTPSSSNQGEPRSHYPGSMIENKLCCRRHAIENRQLSSKLFPFSLCLSPSWFSPGRLTVISYF